MCLDNASLVYYGAGVDAYRHWLNGSLESAPSFDDVIVQTALLEEYEDILDLAESAVTKEEILNITPIYENMLERIRENIQAYIDLSEAQIQMEEYAAENAKQYYANAISDYCLNNVVPTIDQHIMSTDVKQVLAAFGL